jgi:hypothetical protein
MQECNYAMKKNQLNTKLSKALITKSFQTPTVNAIHPSTITNLFLEIPCVHEHYRLIFQ